MELMLYMLLGYIMHHIIYTSIQLLLGYVMSSDRNFEKVQGPLNYLLATFMIGMVLGMIIGTILMVVRNFRKQRSGVKRMSEIMTRIRSSTTSSHSERVA